MIFYNKTKYLFWPLLFTGHFFIDKQKYISCTLNNRDKIQEHITMEKSKQKQDKRNILATSIASPFASMIAKFILHPVDTIKSKVQVNRMQLKKVSDYKPGTVFNLVKQTWANQGISGFFRGVTISVVGSAIAFSFYMTAYEKSKQVLSTYPFFHNHSTICHLISGFLAQIVSCSLWLPIDIIKERMQVQSQVKIYTYKNPLQAVKKIHLSQGVIGLYRAFGATLLFFGPFSAIFFATFEQMKKWVVKDKENQTMTESIICSASAGSIAGYITTPLEIVKLRMQIQRADVAQTGGKLQNSIFGYKNAFHGLQQIVLNEGFLSLYKGGFLRVCFSAPITTISMSLTEYFKQKILKREQLLDQFI